MTDGLLDPSSTRVVIVIRPSGRDKSETLLVAGCCKNTVEGAARRWRKRSAERGQDCAASSTRSTTHTSWRVTGRTTTQSTNRAHPMQNVCAPIYRALLFGCSISKVCLPDFKSTLYMHESFTLANAVSSALAQVVNKRVTHVSNHNIIRLSRGALVAAEQVNLTVCRPKSMKWNRES